MNLNLIKNRMAFINSGIKLINKNSSKEEIILALAVWFANPGDPDIYEDKIYGFEMEGDYFSISCPSNAEVLYAAAIVDKKYGKNKKIQ